MTEFLQGALEICLKSQLPRSLVNIQQISRSWNIYIALICISVTSTLSDYRKCACWSQCRAFCIHLVNVIIFFIIISLQILSERLWVWVGYISQIYKYSWFINDRFYKFSSTIVAFPCECWDIALIQGYLSFFASLFVCVFICFQNKNCLQQSYDNCSMIDIQPDIQHNPVFLSNRSASNSLLEHFCYFVDVFINIKTGIS